MAPLPPVPTPTDQRIRELRMRLVPLLVFVTVATLVAMMWNQRLGPLSFPGEVDAVEARIASPIPGTVTAVNIRDLQEVTQDDLVIQVTGVDQTTIFNLKAPMSGTVAFVKVRTGENIIAGEALASITQPKPNKIIGFLRQPMTIEPREGMTVRVRPRSLNKVSGRATIIRVGEQLLPIKRSLLPHENSRGEMGLPVMVSLPPELRLYPGELVDLTVEP